jgi:hypothetical protein
MAMVIGFLPLLKTPNRPSLSARTMVRNKELISMFIKHFKGCMWHYPKRYIATNYCKWVMCGWIRYPKEERVEGGERERERERERVSFVCIVHLLRQKGTTSKASINLKKTVFRLFELVSWKNHLCYQTHNPPKTNQPTKNQNYEGKRMWNKNRDVSENELTVGITISSQTVQVKKV